VSIFAAVVIITDVVDIAVKVNKDDVDIKADVVIGKIVDSCVEIVAV
jgi:hypothetical protein